MEELKKLYKDTTGIEVNEVEVIPGAGSNRQYYRLKGIGGSALIGVVGTSRDENHTFCYLANHFTKHSEFSNACCTIRKGQLVTTARNKKDKPEE